MSHLKGRNRVRLALFNKKKAACEAWKKIKYRANHKKGYFMEWVNQERDDPDEKHLVALKLFQINFTQGSTLRIQALRIGNYKINSWELIDLKLF